MREILADVTRALETHRPCVWCAVVETRGSTPQKAGAIMLVYPDGTQSGTLGGGCVEAEVKQRALRLLVEGGAPDVLTFCLDDNYGWDDGLICGGRMSILADPLTNAECATRNAESEGGAAVGYYRCLRELVESGRGCTEAVVIAEQGNGVRVGSRYLFDPAGNPTAQLAAGPPPD